MLPSSASASLPPSISSKPSVRPSPLLPPLSSSCASAQPSTLSTSMPQSPSIPPTSFSNDTLINEEPKSSTFLLAIASPIILGLFAGLAISCLLTISLVIWYCVSKRYDRSSDSTVKFQALKSSDSPVKASKAGTVSASGSGETDESLDDDTIDLELIPENTPGYRRRSLFSTLNNSAPIHAV